MAQTSIEPLSLLAAPAERASGFTRRPENRSAFESHLTRAADYQPGDPPASRPVPPERADEQPQDRSTAGIGNPPPAQTPQPNSADPARQSMDPESAQPASDETPAASAPSETANLAPGSEDDPSTPSEKEESEIETVEIGGIGEVDPTQEPGAFSEAVRGVGEISSSAAAKEGAGESAVEATDAAEAQDELPERNRASQAPAAQPRGESLIAESTPHTAAPKSNQDPRVAMTASVNAVTGAAETTSARKNTAKPQPSHASAEQRSTDSHQDDAVDESGTTPPSKRAEKKTTTSPEPRRTATGQASARAGGANEAASFATTAAAVSQASTSPVAPETAEATPVAAGSEESQPLKPTAAKLESPAAVLNRSQSAGLARQADRAAQPDGEPRVDAARFIGRVAKAFQTAQERGGALQLRLSPPELGALRLELSVREGVMTASLETETSAARRILLDHLPALRERLAEQNIRIERFDVDVRDESRNGNAHDRGPQHDRQDHNRPPATRPPAVPSPRASEPPSAEVSTPRTLSSTSINLVI